MDRTEHPYLALLTIGLGAWLFFTSGAIANIALPHLTEELGVSPSEIVWVTVAFQIAAVSFTIAFAGLAETIGIKRMYLSGLVVFALGSVACGLAGNFSQLTAARILQGLGAAGISSVNAALVRRSAPEGTVGRTLGYLAIITGLSQAAAPVLGSLILESGTWRWLFLYDLPLTAATFALASFAIRKDEPSGRRFDVISALLCVPTLGLGFFALDRLARTPSNMTAMVLLTLAVIAGIVIVRRERGRERPLFPIDLLTLPTFAIPGAISSLTYASQGVALTALPFLLVSTLDMTLVEAGTMISVLPIAILLTAPIAGLVCDRAPRWPVGIVGNALMAVAFFGLFKVAPLHDRSLMTVLMVLLGIGFSMIQNHNAKAMILGAPIARIGAAGGIQSTVRVIGMMTGPALVGISFHAVGDGGSLVAILMGAGPFPDRGDPGRHRRQGQQTASYSRDARLIISPVRLKETTTSSRWLMPLHRKLTMPALGRDFDSRSDKTSVSE